MKDMARSPAEGTLVQVPPVETHRTLFLSDIHLGTRTCQAESLLAFLDANEAETIYLVGDVVDHWRSLAKTWPVAHLEVLRRLLDMAKSGTRIVYVPGNHDAFFRAFAGSTFEGIEIRLEAMHKTANGFRLLVAHGDQSDLFSHRLPILAKTGSLVETLLRDIDALQRRACRAVGLSDWRGIERLISAANSMMRRYDGFEDRLCDLARARNLDGIVCGHFHQPALTNIGGIVYANCGDWTENATAIVEEQDGSLRLVRFEESSVASVSPPAATGEHALVVGSA